MRFKITLRPLDPEAVLPLSYQYELGSWIYKVVARGEPDLAKFLHETGYGTQSRRFKLFSFSNLSIPRWAIKGDRLQILSSAISFKVAFLENKAASGLIGGILREAVPFSLGDKISKCRFLLEQVEEDQFVLPDQDTVHIRATSPVFVTRPKVKPNGKFGKDFLSPSVPEFWEKLTRNLWSKYDVARKEGLVSKVAAETMLRFELCSKEPRKKGIRIKAFTPEETHNIGYMFDFKLTAPRELIRLGLLAGFGEENAMGFGATEIISSQFNNLSE